MWAPGLNPSKNARDAELVEWFTHYMRFTCVLCQSGSPFRWTRVTRVTQALGSSKNNRLQHCFLLVVSLIFLSVVLRFHSLLAPSLRFTLSVLLSLVRSLQSAVRSLRFTPTDRKTFACAD